MTRRIVLAALARLSKNAEEIEGYVEESFTFTGCLFCSNVCAGWVQQQFEQRCSKPNQIVVTYQLKQNGKAFAKKKITQPKKSVVMTGLKKGWSVKASKGFITEIAGKKQNVAKKTYWLYTINGKMAKKGATTQPVKNHDKVVFDLSVTK